MDKLKVATGDISRWEQLYSNQLGALPWVSADVPLDPLREFFDLLERPKRILDFGCGNGRVAEVLDRWGATVIGADCAGAALSNARPLQQGSYVRACSLDEFIEREFNGLVLWGVLHHYAPQTWSTWLELASKVLLSPGLILLGGFDCSDTGFEDKPVRVSPTTGVNAYCLHESFIEDVMKNVGCSVIKSNVIELQDGVTEKRRTWRYVIGRI